jgi:hypothetical protein
VLTAATAAAVREAPPNSRRAAANTAHAAGAASESPDALPAPTPLTPPATTARRVAVITGTDATDRTAAAAGEDLPVAEPPAEPVTRAERDTRPGVPGIVDPVLVDPVLVEPVLVDPTPAEPAAALDPADPVVSANAIGIDATADPTPNATANAPTRPT